MKQYNQQSLFAMMKHKTHENKQILFHGKTGQTLKNKIKYVLNYE